jgi:cytochrome d ubiquinol oxidase subunit I
MKVADAVTGNDGVWITFGVLSGIYVAMGIAATVVLRSMARRWREGEPIDLPTPYSTDASAP